MNKGIRVTDENTNAEDTFRHYVELDSADKMDARVELRKRRTSSRNIRGRIQLLSNRTRMGRRK